MAISQSEKELDAAFETALQLKEEIQKNYILKTGNNKNLPEEIMQFIESSREIVNRYAENKTTTEDILLARIMGRFHTIYNLINSKPTRKFFQPNQDEQIKLHLKTINEIFNMLLQKTSNQATEQYSRPAPGA
ncbi:MAG: hypothetical protein WA659_02400 [Candidatus Aquirickettsiella sp.]